MVAEIISVGTELLLGQIVDTNAAYLGRTLAGLGVDLYYKSTVGDNEGRILDTIARARDRADLILTSGGVGPTEDDLTKECVAKVFGEELVIDAESLEHVESFFRRRGAVMAPRNRKQALIYESGRPIDNPNGTAPGALLEKDGKIVISMPGPPNEMIPMVENHVVPLLTERLSGERQYLVTRVLRFAGIGESAAEHELRDLLASTNPTIAPLAHTGEVHFRLGAKAGSPEEARRLIEPLEAEVRRRLGSHIYGIDKTTLEDAVVALLREHGRTVGAVEFGSAANLSARLGAVPGADEIFLGGILIPNAAAVCGWLNGRVSRELSGAALSEALALVARERLGADYGVGIAAQGVGRSSGEAHISVATCGGIDTRENHFVGGAEAIRRRSSQIALQMIRDSLLDA